MYDQAVWTTRDHFRATQNYNFFVNNCHSFVAYCLEAGDVGSRGTKRRTWDMVRLAAYMFFFGKYISVGKFLTAHLPFLILLGIIGFFVGLPKFT
jgi:hypothetical protein